MAVDGGYVERCAECNGAFTVVASAQTDPIAVRMAARCRRYLAEYVMTIHDVPKEQHGHRAYCSMEKGGAT